MVERGIKETRFPAVKSPPWWADHEAEATEKWNAWLAR